MSTHPMDGPHCSDCGASVRPTASECWLCHRPLSPETITTTGPAHAAGTAVGGGVLLVVLAFLIVLAGAMISLPLVGVLMAVVTVPALATVMRHKAAPGGPEDRVGKTASVLATAGAALGVIVAGLIAFAAVCGPVGFLGFIMAFEQRDPGLEKIGVLLVIAAYLLGIVAGIAVIRYLRRRLWPKPGGPG